MSRYELRLLSKAGDQTSTQSMTTILFDLKKVQVRQFVGQAALVGI